MAYSYFGVGLYSDSLYSQNPILDSNSDTYGASGYGIGLFSAPEVGASITATAQSSASGAVTRVRLAASSISSSASGTCSARRVPEGSALVYGTSSTGTSSISTGARIRTGYANPAGDASGSTIAATRVRESDSADTSTASGSANSVFIVSASASTSVTASPTGTAACNWISSGSLSASSSTTSSADLVLDSGQITDNAGASVSLRGAATFKGSSAISSTATNTALAGYVQRSSAAVSSTSTIVSIGREKWEIITYGGSSPWTTIAA